MLGKSLPNILQSSAFLEPDISHVLCTPQGSDLIGTAVGFQELLQKRYELTQQLATVSQRSADLESSQLPVPLSCAQAHQRPWPLRKAGCL